MAVSSLSHWMYSFFKSDSSDSFSGFTQDDLLSDVNNIDTIHTEEKNSSDSEIDSTYQDCFPVKSNMADSSNPTDIKTDVQTLRGVNINNITDKIMNSDLTRYNQIIILVGGNDNSEGLGH